MHEGRIRYSRLAARVVTSVAIEAAHVAALDARAAREGITRSGVLRAILDQTLEGEAENPDGVPSRISPRA